MSENANDPDEIIFVISTEPIKKGNVKGSTNILSKFWLTLFLDVTIPNKVFKVLIPMLTIKATIIIQKELTENWNKI